MELWIKSQNRKELLNVNNLAVIENRIVFINNGNGRATLGIYKTKERALEVLDEIQEAQLGNYHYRCPSNVKVSNNEDMIVYEMPKD